MNDLMQDADNPLEFWVAYIPGEGEKRNYLSDGNGHLRVFKKEIGMREFLKQSFSEELLKNVIVHSVQGQIAVPDEMPVEVAVAPRELPPMTSITTLAAQGVPTATELLDYYKKKRIRRRK